MNLNKKMWLKRQVTTKLQKSLGETQDLVVVKLKYEITWITFRNITVLVTVENSMLIKNQFGIVRPRIPSPAPWIILGFFPRLKTAKH